MPKKREVELVSTIYVVTNDDNVILSAFTSMEDAKSNIENRYLVLGEHFNIEPCSLTLGIEFIEFVKKLKI